MARPRSFDRDDVLDRALETFWDQGYEATSVQDLVDAMELSRASLYNTFGDKHALYVEVLQRYETEWVRRLLDTLQTPGDAVQAIRTLLERVADEAAACPKRGSCLLTNAATELAHRDDETADHVRSNLGRIEDAFGDVLRRGRERGVIRDDATVDAQARFLTNTLQGLRVLAKTCPDRDALQDVVDVTLRAVVASDSDAD